METVFGISIALISEQLVHLVAIYLFQFLIFQHGPWDRTFGACDAAQATIQV